MPIKAHKTTLQLPLLGPASSRLGLLLFFSMVTIRDTETSTSLVTIGTQNGLGCLCTVYHNISLEKYYTVQKVQTCVSGIKSSVISGSHAQHLGPANRREIEG